MTATYPSSGAEVDLAVQPESLFEEDCWQLHRSVQQTGCNCSTSEHEFLLQMSLFSTLLLLFSPKNEDEEQMMLTNSV